MTASALPKSTNIELDRTLLAKAQEVLGNNPSIKDTVEEGLRRIVAEQALRDLAEYMAQRTPEEREFDYNVRNIAW